MSELFGHIAAAAKAAQEGERRAAESEREKAQHLEIVDAIKRVESRLDALLARLAQKESQIVFALQPYGLELRIDPEGGYYVGPKLCSADDLGCENDPRSPRGRAVNALKRVWGLDAQFRAYTGVMAILVTEIAREIEGAPKDD